jgi:Zn-dependent peptidase ImmA (M78 family)
MNTVAIKPALIDWAIQRSGLSFSYFVKYFPKLEAWQKEEAQPTINQLESFARKTQTPFGYFFLEEPPVETIPIPDFRTLGDQLLATPSPNLIETIQKMQLRQSWMHDYLVELREKPLSFVGTKNIRDDIYVAAEQIRGTLGLTEDWSFNLGDWREALHFLINSVDETGILIMKNGVVGNNTHRKLNVKEFRGFVLIDSYAPLIFINGNDYEAAQMFTIAHELAHVWLGKDALFNLHDLQPFNNDIEKYCNVVAAEFLVSQKMLKEFWPAASHSENPYKFLSRKFKVSQIVIARRALDLNLIDHNQFYQYLKEYKEEQEQFLEKKKESAGGNYYNTQNVRIGRRFAIAVRIATKEGRLSYKDAFKLTGLNNKTFDKYFNKLGI